MSCQQFSGSAVYNYGSEAVDLSGFQFVDGIQFEIPSGTVLEPQAYLVIVNDTQAFALRYGTDARVLGEYEGKLSNGGEYVELVDAWGHAVLDFKYENAGDWPTAADGQGKTLEISAAVDAAVADFSNPISWRASDEDGGSPGRASAPVSVMAGDIDGDGVVAFADFLVLSANFGSAGTAAQGDIDGDGVIAFSDFVILANSFGVGAAAFVTDVDKV